MKFLTFYLFTFTPFIFIFLFLSHASLLAQNKEEHLRLIHADVLQRETIGQRVQQKLEGHVKFQQGSTIIQCDLATQIIDQEPAALIGHVKIFDENKTLVADTVYFYQKEAKQVAVGNVISITESDTTTADRLTYFEKENKIISESNVRIINPEERTILTGDYVEYWRNEKYGKVWHNPVLIKLDSLGKETMTILGDTMHFFNGGKRTLVVGNVQIIQSGTHATCKRAEYFREEGKTLLTEHPKVVQKNRQISGDTLWLYLNDSQLSRAHVIGNALATSDADTLNQGRWVNKLSGHTMNFYFENKKLTKVIIEQQATSVYHNIKDQQYKGVNEVSGDKIVILLNNGEAQRILVTSIPEFSSGKYSPPRL
ncbi:MAG: LptA/OstA family protein [bacterium]